MSLDGELNDLLVVSIEQAVAAPYCSMMLADAGARVIKIERPEGDFARGYDRGADGQSAIFAWLNRGKESLCVNLDDHHDSELLRRIIARADVFLSNLAPGSLERRGFAGADLRKHNPELITCSITGYGAEEGAGRKAYDFLVQGESGICAVTGTEEAPARVGVPITDLSTGLTAHSAILRALIRRAKTGTGAELSVSMFDVMADWMNMALIGHRHLGGAPARSGLTHTFISPYGAYATGDGGQVLLSIQNNREWAAFCREVISRPELVEDVRFADNADRFANRSVLEELITASFSGLTTGEVVQRLDGARIANARLNSVAELSEHSLLRNLTIRFGSAEVEVADLPVPGQGTRHTDAPVLDQHGAAIRTEFAQRN